MTKKQIYGLELILNLSGCDINIITSKEKLQGYVDRLCEIIKMKKYGKAIIPYFGTNAEHTAGYSLVQLIETSSITGHFSDAWRKAYINIFSCKSFDVKKAANFTKHYFKASSVEKKILRR